MVELLSIAFLKIQRRVCDRQSDGKWPTCQSNPGPKTPKTRVVAPGPTSVQSTTRGSTYPPYAGDDLKVPGYKRRFLVGSGGRAAPHTPPLPRSEPVEQPGSPQRRVHHGGRLPRRGAARGEVVLHVLQHTGQHDGHVIHQGLPGVEARVRFQSSFLQKPRASAPSPKAAANLRACLSTMAPRSWRLTRAASPSSQTTSNPWLGAARTVSVSVLPCGKNRVFAQATSSFSVTAGRGLFCVAPLLVRISQLSGSLFLALPAL